MFNFAQNGTYFMFKNSKTMYIMNKFEIECGFPHRKPHRCLICDIDWAWVWVKSYLKICKLHYLEHTANIAYAYCNMKVYKCLLQFKYIMPILKWFIIGFTLCLKFHILCKMSFQTLFVSQAQAIFKLYSYVQINRNSTARC